MEVAEKYDRVVKVFAGGKINRRVLAPPDSHTNIEDVIMIYEDKMNRI